MAEEDINIFEQAMEYIPTKDELKNFSAKAGSAVIDFPIMVANVPLLRQNPLLVMEISRM